MTMKAPETEAKDRFADKVPWDEKTQEEKAKAVCDHLVQEHLSGNLRPVSEDKSVPRNPTTKPEGQKKEKATVTPWTTP